MTPWEAFCQHAKAGLQEEYQSNWLNENQENQIVTDAFIQAKMKNFASLKIVSKNLETNLDWILNGKYDRILSFIVSYKNSLIYWIY